MPLPFFKMFIQASITMKFPKRVKRDYDYPAGHKYFEGTTLCQLLIVVILLFQELLLSR